MAARLLVHVRACQQCGVSPIDGYKFCSSCRPRVPAASPRTKNCKGCGKAIPSLANRQYCSADCRPHHYQPRRVWVTTRCAVCAAEFTFLRATRPPIFCSDDCRSQGEGREKSTANCLRCGSSFYPRRAPAQLYCSLRCRPAPPRIYATKTDKSRAHHHRRKARKHAVAYEPISATKIFERDGWKCGICLRKVNHLFSHPHPGSASLDHIIPLARGGSHTKSNVQCAHLRCNELKGDRYGGDQLKLAI